MSSEAVELSLNIISRVGRVWWKSFFPFVGRECCLPQALEARLGSGCRQSHSDLPSGKKTWQEKSWVWQSWRRNRDKVFRKGLLKAGERQV